MSSLEAVRRPSLSTMNSMDKDMMMRGRRMDRTAGRASHVASLRTEESSTLRGRSRQRAGSPASGLASSRNSSSSSLRLQNRLRDARRQHCPSRPASPARHHDLARRRHRSRGRSSRPLFDLESARTPATNSKSPTTATMKMTMSDLSSRLRNEVFMDEDENEYSQSLMSKETLGVALASQT